MNNSGLEVLNPVATSWGESHGHEPAKRPQTLENKRVGLFWNGKHGGDVALARLGELLQQKLKRLQLVRIDGAVPSRREVVERAKQLCDVAIGATGD